MYCVQGAAVVANSLTKLTTGITSANLELLARLRGTYKQNAKPMGAKDVEIQNRQWKASSDSRGGKAQAEAKNPPAYECGEAWMLVEAMPDYAFVGLPKGKAKKKQ